MTSDSFDELLEAASALARQESSDKIDEQVEQLRNAHLPAGVRLGDEDEQAIKAYLRTCMTLGSNLYLEEGYVARETVLFTADQCVKRCDPHLATMIPDLRLLCEKAVVRGIRHMQGTGY